MQETLQEFLLKDPFQELVLKDRTKEVLSSMKPSTELCGTVWQEPRSSYALSPVWLVAAVRHSVALCGTFINCCCEHVLSHLNQQNTKKLRESSALQNPSS